MARAQLAPDDQMTIEEFLAFTDSRPDGERWELIEGMPVLNPSPIDYHQIVVTNIAAELMNWRNAHCTSWIPMIGTGTRVPASVNSLPQPDVMVKEHAPTGTPVSDDALVLFEVLSRSNSKKDQAWRRRVYASVPNCQHYVTVSLKAVEVTSYDRSTGWQARPVTRLDAKLDLSALGLCLPLSVIYRATPLAPAVRPS